VRRQVFAEELQHLRIELSVEVSTVEAGRIINALERHRLRFIVRAREKKVEMCGIGGTVELRAVGQVPFQGHDIFRSDTQATAFRAPQLNWGRYLLQTGLIWKEADRVSDYKGLDARVKSESCCSGMSLSRICLHICHFSGHGNGGTLKLGTAPARTRPV
jgi:hypothetical protein